MILALQANVLLDGSFDYPDSLTGLLAGFGSGKVFGMVAFDSTTQTSPAWLPPEYTAINFEECGKSYSSFGDMWSFGCTFLEVSVAHRSTAINFLIVVYYIR